MADFAELDVRLCVCVWGGGGGGDLKSWISKTKSLLAGGKAVHAEAKTAASTELDVRLCQRSV